MKQEFVFGNILRDKVTGFEGMYVGKCEYMTGCTQLRLQPKVKPDGSYVEGLWLDEGKIELIGDGELRKDNVQGKENGADFTPPR